MTISPIADLYSYGGYIRSAAGASAIKTVAEISSIINSAAAEKSASQDQKNNLVSENSDPKGNTVVYDYRFLPNVPVSKPQDTEKTFNEPQKTSKKDNDKKSFSNYLDEPETEEEAAPQETTGKGFYIVFNDSTPTPEKKTSFSAQELWQERIKNTYHLSRLKQNGALVNLTF